MESWFCLKWKSDSGDQNADLRTLSRSTSANQLTPNQAVRDGDGAATWKLLNATNEVKLNIQISRDVNIYIREGKKRNKKK
jgi:hypothetical protein